MSDQYDFANDSVAWDDWLQLEELQQPFWAGVVEVLAFPPSTDTDHQLPIASGLPEDPGLAPSNLYALGSDSSQWSNASAGTTMNDPIDSHVQSMCGVEASLYSNPCGNIENSDLNQVLPSDPGYTDEASESLAASRITQRLVYMKSQCATCDAPLDNSEQILGFEDPEVYCTRNRGAGHLPVGCLECNAKHSSLKDFKNSFHAHYSFHCSFRCAVPDCSAKIRPHEAAAHYRDQHPNEQYLYRCAQCNLGFKTHNDLDEHGGQTMHAAYRCRYPECGSECTRVADLKRHQLTHRSILQRHACPHCRKYRGDNGFKRKDHLRQHIRNYHHIEVDAQGVDADGSAGHSCPFEGCNKTGSNVFETEKLLKVHLKKEHPSPFQCSYPGCDRVGTKGWFRERDMFKHMKKVHDV